MRLDRYLAQSGERTRSEAARLLRSGAVRVNGEPVRDGGFHLKPDDRVVIKGVQFAMPGAKVNARPGRIDPPAQLAAAPALPAPASQATLALN